MSLQPELEYTVPEQTARIARAAFPKRTLCMKIYDHLGTIFRDQDFADIFPRRGQPAQSPFPSGAQGATLTVELPLGD